MLRCGIHRAYPHLLVRSRRCSSSTSLPVDQTFTSKYVAKDGRVFLFATVVVNEMGKGQSALPAWQHACSLVKANPPTLAIAFLSRPTDSALAAVSDLAHQFSLTSNDVGGVCHDYGGFPDLSSKARQVHSPHHSDDGSVADGPCFSGHKNPFLHPLESDASCNPASCNSSAHMADQSLNLLSVPCSTGSLTSVPTMPHEDTLTHVEPQLASIPPLIGCIVADQGRAAMTTSIIRANAAMGDDVFWLGAPDDEGDNLHAGGGAWNGGFGSRDKKSGVVEGNSGSGDGASCNRQQCSNALNMQMLSEKMFMDENWKPFSRSFSIEVNDPNTLNSCSSESENVFKQFDEQYVGVSLGKDKFAEYALEIQSSTGQQMELFCAKKVACEGEVSGKRTSETFTQHKVLDRANKSLKRTGNGHDHGDEAEETYRLSLCVASMPGVKATGFYSRTARLPWLPNLRSAVSTNHPHMVLLGTPGFNLVEFDELLAHMFPNGSRSFSFDYRGSKER